MGRVQTFCYYTGFRSINFFVWLINFGTLSGRWKMRNTLSNIQNKMKMKIDFILGFEKVHRNTGLKSKRISPLFYIVYDYSVNLKINEKV